MKNLFLLLGIALLFGCSDQIKQERTFTGEVKRASTNAPREQVLVSVYQDNGKDFPKNDIEVENDITDANGGFSMSIRPFNNEESSNIQLLVQVSEIAAYSGGITEFVYTVAEEIFDKNEVLEQTEGEPIQADILTKNYSILTLAFTLDGADPLTWQGNLRIYNDNFSHSLTLNGEDFKGIFKFPVDDGEEFTISLSGTTDSGRVDIEETFSIAAPSGAEGEATFRLTL